MPLSVPTSKPIKFPEPEYLTLGNFKQGVITLIDKSRLPKTALEQADNIFLVEDGQPSIRPGVNWFGTTPYLPAGGAATLTKASGSTLGVGVYKYQVTFVNAQGETVGGTEASVTTSAATTKVNLTNIPLGAGGTTARKIYRTAVGGATGTEKLVTTIADNTSTTYSDSLADASLGAAIPTTSTASLGEVDGYDYFDFNGVIHLVMVSDGNVMRSTDDGTTWTICTGATLTDGKVVSMNQNGSFLYLTTGVDNIVRYDGSTTLQTYTVLTTPAAPTAAVTGLTGTNFTVYYQISAVNQIGFTVASTAVSQAVSITRDSWDTTHYITLTLPAPQATQTRYDIYYSEDNINFYYLDSIISSVAVPNVTYVDNGNAIVSPGTLAPTGNTTQGIGAAELINVGSRQFGVRDPNNRYRIYFSGSGAQTGSFSDAYDGGYLDWQPGGKFYPVKVEDYRDGKGTPLATIWCDSADGRGCILQMSLDTTTVGSLNITVPSAYQLPGSRGTNAPGSVISVLNDYFFYNSQAFYNLGSRAQFLNLLSTDEASANIRPTVRQISTTGASGIASVYFDARVYFSVPYGSTTNNATVIYDTERKCWLPKAFTIGFKKFLRYTDTSGNHRLLAVKPGDTRLSEISDDFQGDYGVAFDTSLLTGLYPTEKDRYEFQFVEEMEIEASNPQGLIYAELLGYERTKGSISVKTLPLNITTTVTNVGWDTNVWDTDIWDDTSVVPDTVSESSVKRYSTVQKELNSVQWHIYTSSLDARYILRSLQTWGTATGAGHPAGWRVRAI